VLGPALAAGNCVVFKPPELAPYACRRIMQHLLDAGVPPGVVNMVTGGPESGRRLVAHPGIDKIHFTGSPQTARSILATAAENITACALELGGKSANVIFADADLDAALPQAMNAIIGKSGQGCIRGTRILAERTVYDEVVERCAAIARTARLGDPMLDTTIMGPVISEAACQRILRTIERATREEGGRLVAGGRRADGELAPGYYLEATVISDVAPQSDLAQNEVFGPVIAVMPFDGEDEALRLANSTPYALAAYVQTNDGGRAHRMARRMNAGNVWINGFGGILPGVPFGGNGISGFGRLGGEAGIKEFLRPKNVWMKL
jgi:acyl-CoA reductase-like NAD-dependent aldehyde dehydrogenase